MANQGNLLELERCPHCSVDKPHLIRQTAFETSNHSKTVKRIWAMYACSRCGGVVTAMSKKNGTYIEEMYPEPLSVDETIPARAKEYLQQAISSINAPAGAVMLAASSVDAMLQEKGLTDGSLYTRINKAVENHLITEGMSLWAHEVRLEANDQRHSDNNTDLPTTEDAKKLIDFVQALGSFLFVLPARVEHGIENAKNS